MQLVWSKNKNNNKYICYIKSLLTEPGRKSIIGVLLETPHGHLISETPRLTMETPRFTSDSPDFQKKSSSLEYYPRPSWSSHLRPTEFCWRLTEFCCRPRPYMFLGNSKLFSETPSFFNIKKLWKALGL